MNKVQNFLQTAGDVLERELRPLLVGECHMSLIVRTPGHPEQTIFVSGDPDFEEVVKTVEYLRGIPMLTKDDLEPKA